MAPERGSIIAIDGVVSSGKSTTARLVAERLGYRHIDTGAMYRCLTLAAMRNEIPASRTEALADFLPTVRIELEPPDRGGRVLLNGEDVSEEIRRPAVTRRVGAYADVALVRRALIEQQQRMGAAGGVVAEGRDAGTVVFPDADLKVMMQASLETRARRRHRELSEKGVDISLDEVEADIRERDRQDAARDYGAESDPSGARQLDTTDLTVEEQVDRIVGWARQLWRGPATG